jgi:hypothetical protein
MSRREARELGRSAWTRVRRFFYAWPSMRMTTAGLPNWRMHCTLWAVPGGGPPIPEREEHVAGLRHLVVAAYTGAFPEALPVCGEAARAHVMPHGPAKAELIRAPSTAGDDLRDAVALRCQCLTQELIVGERTGSGDDELHADLPGCWVCQTKKAVLF